MVYNPEDNLTVEDSGSKIIEAVNLNFGAGLSVSDDGDSTITVDAAAEGSDGQLQYNDGGSFGGTTVTWDSANTAMDWGSNDIVMNGNSVGLGGSLGSGGGVAILGTTGDGFGGNVAIGGGAEALDDESTAVGGKATVNGGGLGNYSGVSVGYQTTTNDYGVAVGKSAVGENGGMAFGADADATGDQAIAIGNGDQYQLSGTAPQANNEFAIALGTGAATSNTNEMRIAGAGSGQDLFIEESGGDRYSNI